MVQSMTGYGKSSKEYAGKKITVEIKSVNSKSLSLRTTVPSAYRPEEIRLRSLIKDKLERGKVDCLVKVEQGDAVQQMNLNKEAILAYVQEFKDLGLSGISDHDDARLLELAMKQPDVIGQDDSATDPDEIEAALNVLEEAVLAFIEFRVSEGSALKTDFEKRIQNLENLLDEVKKLDPEREKAVRQKLKTAVVDLKAEVDEERFEQELVFYLEKYDITEEKIRLAKHLEYFSETLENKGSNGKKLNFISQEIGREINTIGSKANFVPIQKCVVQMKDELEKIKEQILNVL